jgi:hypothetical protein
MENNKVHQKVRCLQGRSVPGIGAQMEGLIGTISNTRGIREVLVSIHSFQIVSIDRGSGINYKAVVIYNAVYRKGGKVT